VRDVLTGERMCLFCSERRFVVAGPCCLCDARPAVEGLWVAFDMMLFLGSACATCLARGPTDAQLAALERRAMAGHSSRQGTNAPGGVA
jgi:hypothetical protein